MLLLPERTHEVVSGGYKVTVTPPAWSGFKASSIVLDEDQFRRYNLFLEKKGLIQDLLPELSSSDREILLSGISPEEFSRL